MTAEWRPSWRRDGTTPSLPSNLHFTTLERTLSLLKDKLLRSEEQRSSSGPGSGQTYADSCFFRDYCCSTFWWRFPAAQLGSAAAGTSYMLANVTKSSDFTTTGAQAGASPAEARPRADGRGSSLPFLQRHKEPFLRTEVRMQISTSVCRAKMVLASAEGKKVDCFSGLLGKGRYFNQK